MGAGDWRSWIALVTTEKSLATGYPIAPDRILTAAHAIGSDVVEVRFFRRDPKKPYQAEVVWPPVGATPEVRALDVAVLRLQEPVAECLLAPRPQVDLLTGERWETEGFPAVAWEDGGAVEAEPLQGTLFSLAAGDPTLKLNLTSEPGKPDGWKGFSGAPVVVGGRIAGLIRELPYGWRGRVEATAFAALWQAPGFREAIGDRAERLLLERYENELRQRLVRLLAREWLRDAVAEALAVAAGGAEEVADEIRGRSSLDVAIALRNVHFQVTEGDIPGGDPRAVEELACAALPQLDQAVEAVTGAIGQLGAETLSLAIETPTVAELAMARLDGRPARFELRGSAIVGPSLLDLSAETGIAPDGFQRSFRRSLAMTLGIPIAFDRPEPAKEIDRRSCARLRALAHDREPQRVSYYGVVTDNPKSPTSIPENRRWIAATYPQLRLLELTGRSDDELDLVEWLRKIFASPGEGDR
jgi:hypothetical protein